MRTNHGRIGEYSASPSSRPDATPVAICWESGWLILSAQRPLLSAHWGPRATISPASHDHGLLPSAVRTVSPMMPQREHPVARGGGQVGRRRRCLPSVSLRNTWCDSTAVVDIVGEIDAADPSAPVAALDSCEPCPAAYVLANKTHVKSAEPFPTGPEKRPCNENRRETRSSEVKSASADGRPGEWILRTSSGEVNHPLRTCHRYPALSRECILEDERATA
jgi:hypothetical protein